MKKYIIGGVVGFLAIVGGLSSIKTIDAGERGVRITLGKVNEDEVLTEGLNFRLPVFQKIVPYSIRTQKLEQKTSAFTKDIQNVQLDMIMNYSIMPEAVTKVYKQYGSRIEELVIIPTLLDEVKNDLGKWEAAQLIENREKSSRSIEETLRRELAKKHVNVIDFRYRDIDFSDEFEKAIEEKVTAGQKVLTERNRSEQEKEKAHQAIIRAQAEAEKITLTAEAKAKAIKIEADAEATALKVKAAALNDDILKLRAIENWDGALPKVINGNKSGQIFDMKDLIQDSNSKAKGVQARKIDSQAARVNAPRERQRESE